MVGVHGDIVSRHNNVATPNVALPMLIAGNFMRNFSSRISTSQVALKRYFEQKSKKIKLFLPKSHRQLFFCSIRIRSVQVALNFTNRKVAGNSLVHFFAKSSFAKPFDCSLSVVPFRISESNTKFHAKPVGVWMIMFF